MARLAKNYLFTDRGSYLQVTVRPEGGGTFTLTTVDGESKPFHLTKDEIRAMMIGFEVRGFETETTDKISGNNSAKNHRGLKKLQTKNNSIIRENVWLKSRVRALESEKERNSYSAADVRSTQIGVRQIDAQARLWSAYYGYDKPEIRVEVPRLSAADRLSIFARPDHTNTHNPSFYNCAADEDLKAVNRRVSELAKRVADVENQPKLVQNITNYDGRG